MSNHPMTPEASAVLKQATELARARRQVSVDATFILKALLGDKTIQTLFGDIGIEIAKVIAKTDEVLDMSKAIVTSMPGIHKSKEFESVVQRAETYAGSKGGDTDVTHLLIAIFSEKTSKALFILQQCDVTRVMVSDWMAKANAKAVEAENGGENGKELEGAGAGTGGKAQMRRRSALAEYCTDLNRQVTKGDLLPTIGRAQEMKNVFRILSRKTKNNAVLVGEPGVGKTAVAEAVARAIVEKTAPQRFHDMRVLSLNLGALVAGTRFRGDFEERIDAILKEMKEDISVILFIDEIHMLIGGGAASGGMDAANLMKPALSRGELRCLGATTYKEYRQYIENDGALARRFQKVDVNEPSKEEVKKIVDGVTVAFEKHHGVSYDHKALDAAIRLTGRYMPNRHFPDKAIDALDEAGATVKLAGRDKVLVADMEAVVAHLSKLPPEAVDANEAKLLARLEDDIKKTVFDQDKAVTEVVDAIQMQRAGLLNPEKPAANFLFVGKTGVGKTELAKTVAKKLGLPFHRFDMSEYTEKHTVARLIGAPPGYVGFEEGGKLTNCVEKDPHAVILFDEIEKAHPTIFDALLGVMDYGKMTDGQNRTTDFRNVIIVMSSNVGAVEASKGAMGFTKTQEQASTDATNKAVERTFTPEFRNRLTAVIHFNDIGDKTAAKVVQRILLETEERLKERDDARVFLKTSDRARDHLAKLAFDSKMGARPAERVVREQVWKPLSKLVLFGGLKNGGTALVDLDDQGKITITVS